MARDKTDGAEPSFRDALEELQQARKFAGEPAAFWPSFLATLVRLAGATVGVVCVRNHEDGAAWGPIALEPADLRAGPYAQTLLAEAAALAEAAGRDGVARQELPDKNLLLGLPLDIGPANQSCVAGLLFRDSQKAGLDEKVRRLQLAADTPLLYQIQRIAAESRQRVEHFAGVLDLMVLVNAQDRFLASAMVLCNELASRHECERVSLGWFQHGYVRMQAMSHIEHFDKKMDAVQKLEAAMEEALEQDEEVIWPAREGDKTIARDHKAFAAAHGVTHMVSLPLRLDGEPVAVCTFERSSRPFGPDELRLLRLACDQAARRLADLKRWDRWFGARLAMSARERLSKLLGPQHTWGKLIAIAMAIGLGFLCFGRIPYRVEATFILRTDDVAYLTAPFAGHIDEVTVRVGDTVAPGMPLLTLDRSELLLEEAAAVAEENRYHRESEKARAAGALADMRISEAVRQQAAVRLDLVRHRLEQSVLTAPFSGVVVEGDLKERLGAPVQQGEVLFKLARLDRMYAELEVDESDIHDVRLGLAGEVAFSSRPQDSFPIQTFRLEPAAVVREEGNVFIVHARLLGAPQVWWRPGMTGVAKLNIGKRTPLWIVTHRTIDFLRLKLWW
ncbi:MAG: efflux RND transporter periplasmic adaptor subunit [Kiritimatiellae bacterium]|nr:efflux RND transporter periplasmic adaptor subunit [Kiritimatiellia bacterium]